MRFSRRTLLGGTLGLTTLAATRPSMAAALAQPPEDGPRGEPLGVTTADGIRLSAMVYGDPANPEILLIHGLGQSRLAWDKQVRALSSRFRIVTFDLRGHGDSSKPDTPEAYADGALWAADIEAVRTAAGLKRPTVVGWSFGGMTLGHYLKRHGADDLQGVVMVGAVTAFEPELFGPSALALGPGLTSPDLSIRVRAIEDTVAATFARPLDEADFRRMLAVNAMAPRALQLGYGLIGSEGITAAFGTPSRMLVVHGDQDAITLPEMSRRLLDLNAAATLSVYAGAGHAPFYEEPDRFNDELARFAVG